MNNIMREEFELAWQIKGRDDEGNLGNKPTRSKVDNNKYAGDATQFAWRWWKASRESIVIKLPRATVKGLDCFYYNNEVEEALDKVGVKYE